MFLQASVCPQGGWGCLPQCMLGYHTPLEQTPPTPGADHPPKIPLLLRTVRILLECILVIQMLTGLAFCAPLLVFILVPIFGCRELDKSVETAL